MIRICIVALLGFTFARSQSPWPSESWASATPLTAIMDADGLNDLSGLHWNPDTNRLYVVHGDGRLRVLQLNTSTNVFTQIANKPVADGPEGITQVDYAANEFYTIDENNYEIRKFTHTANFSTVTESRHWDLLASPSPMNDTGNNGPEGIVFVPDSALLEIGFISQQTGSAYTSVKGMGGLMFIAHQSGGYIWVFDLNPDVNNDFAYVGKYKTKHTESTDLAFDRSTGLLYILHNIDSNYIEVTDLSSTIVSGERKFTALSDYFATTPSDGNINIEGFAISPKCPGGNPVNAWLCRDVESDEDDAILQDAIRWFSPFNADGICSPLSTNDIAASALDNFEIFPNPSHNEITLSFPDLEIYDVRIVNALGQLMLETKNYYSTIPINISGLQKGIYFIGVLKNQIKCVKTLIKS